MERKAYPEFYRQIFKLLIPIVIQNMLNAAVSSADVMMLSFVGQSAISAVSLASNYAGVLFSINFGLGTGVTMLTAQYYGKGDLRAIRAVEGIALRLGLVFSLVFGGAALLIPRWMMLLFTNDGELIELGCQYLRIVSLAYICWGITEIYTAVLRSMGRATICMVLNAVGFALNILLNAVFIFGLFGAPKLGIRGVAMATAISALSGPVGCLLISIKAQVKLNPRYLLVRNKALSQDFRHLALPALANDIIWGVAFSMYSVILGHMGSDAVAANAIVIVVRNLSTVFCFAAASAGTILLGNVMGEGNLPKAKVYAAKMLRLTVFASLLGGVVILCLIPLILSMSEAKLTAQALGYLKGMLLINSYYITGAAVNTALIAGVFRAGGDTKFGMICDTIDMWCYAVPLGFLAAFVFKLPVMVVYFLLCTDEFVKWPWVIKRYKSGIWLKNITRDDLFDGTEQLNA